MVRRFEIYLLNLDDEPSNDAKNTRPCAIVSPDEMNKHLSHVVIAPISGRSANCPTRIAVELLNSERSIVLDQIRTVETARLVKKIGDVAKPARKQILERLQEMFAE